MALDGKDLAEEVLHRQNTAELVLDSVTGRRATYAQWHRGVDQIDQVLQNAWGIAWPDDRETFGEPHVPNVPLIAVEDRTRLVAAGNPSIVCRPEDVTATAKRGAERRERVLGGYWEINHVRRKIAQWAPDLMVAGLSVVKVLPDFSAPVAERFPVYTRIDPRLCYPSPMFTEGPEPDDMLVSYQKPWRTVAKMFDRKVELAKLLGPEARAGSAQVEVIEYYDDEYLCAIARYQRNAGSKPEWEWLLEPMEHKLRCTPVAIGARPNPLGLYQGDFPSILGALRNWNRMEAMSVDAMIDRTYAVLKRTSGADVENMGPGGEVILEDERAVAEYMVAPGEPFSNYQNMKAAADGVRAGALLPPARTGDPNESIISAAGISAANSQMADHVRSLQRDCIAPMLAQANSIALNVDEVHCNAEKTIYGYARGRAYQETYTPTALIKGNYRNSVTYGMGAGLDEVNANILVLQQLGAGLIAKRTAREMSPFSEDPQREEQLVATEHLVEAMFAGLLAQAAQGMLPAQTVAAIMDDLQKPDVTLQEAVANNLIAAPMAEPEPMPMPAMASGNAGSEQPTGFQGPPLEQLLGGPRPGR